MADTPAPKKQRRLRAAPQTMRERAEHSANKQPKPKRFQRLARVTQPLASFLGKVRTLKIWRPFKAVGRFLKKWLIPPYIRGSFMELRQVTWPNRRQTLQLTSAVLIFAVVFGIIVAVFDLGLDKLFKQVILR